MSLKELKTKSWSSILTFLKQDKKLIVWNSRSQAVIIPRKDYERYRQNEFMEQIDKDALEAEQNWPFFDTAKEAMDYLTNEIREW